MKLSANVYKNRKGEVNVNIRMSIDDGNAVMVNNDEVMQRMRKVLGEALQEKGHSVEGQ